jgi:hypothetical protein
VFVASGQVAGGLLRSAAMGVVVNVVATVVLVLPVIAGCQAPATPTPAATSPDTGPGRATPTLPLPGASVRPFPSPTIEIPPPID